MPFLLIEHGSVEYDAYPGRFRGHGIDLLPLSRQGVADAEALALRLEASGGLDLIVSSSMARAMHTAMILSWRLGTHVDVELDLHEWVPDLSQQWSDGEVPRAAYEDLVACGGEWPEGQQRSWEPHSSVRRRVLAVLARYANAGSVGVVCHSGVIEALTGVSHIESCGVVRYDLP
jgi:broad specificity phosphatase PhoE